MTTDSPRLIQNAFWIPEDNLYLISTHVHDYREHKLSDGKFWMVDGGCDYLRYGGDMELLGTRVLEWHLYENDPFEVICRKLLWGSRGKDGKSPLRHRPIAELSLDHLRVIQSTQKRVKPGSFHGRVIAYWIAAKEMEGEK